MRKCGLRVMKEIFATRSRFKAKSHKPSREQIRATLSRRQQAVLRNPKTVSPDAYEDYLKGRYFWNKRTETV